jgi:hypothetical protein
MIVWIHWGQRFWCVELYVLWLGVRKIKRHLLVLRNFRAQANMSWILLVLGVFMSCITFWAHPY